ncbi:MAG: LysR family transcriptional regulator [Firmicutes bacterium]|nr:LysR family transcriptional regulator [Bacillota bacterium]
MNILNFDLNLYKPFVAVYENKNITKAAEKLIITPSAVGMRIKELERQLGIKLFTPHARGVHPTKEADELYAKINPALASIIGAGSTLVELSSESTGVLRIGCQVNIAMYYLADIISEFILAYPKIKIEIHHESRPKMSEMLARRELDIVISKLPFKDPFGNFVIETLIDLPKGFYATEKFLKANNLSRVITREQLFGTRIILASKIRSDIQMLMSALGQNINSSIEIAGGNEFIYEMIRRHVGIGYVNECCVNENDGVVSVTVSGVKLPQFNLGVVYNKDDASKIINEFIKMLKSGISN